MTDLLSRDEMFRAEASAPEAFADAVRLIEEFDARSPAEDDDA